MKMTKKLISVMLVISMLMSSVTTVVFAQGSTGNAAEEINYVSLGDSMTNGYGFKGYEQGDDRVPLSTYDIMNGVGVYGEKSYPVLFEQYLDSLDNVPGNVNHTKLATSAMLPEHLLYLLSSDTDTFADIPTDGYSGFRSYVGQYRYGHCLDLKNLYQNAVAEADVISMGIGNASFGAFLTDYLTHIMGVGNLEWSEARDEETTLENALELLEDEEQKALVLEIYANLKSELATYVDFGMLGTTGDGEKAKLELMCDVIAYATARFMLSYNAILEQIDVLNDKDDLKVIIVGLMNTLSGVELVDANGDVVIAIGDLMNDVFGALNAYMAAMPTKMQSEGKLSDITFYFAEEKEVECYNEIFEVIYNDGNWNGQIDGIDPQTVRDRTIGAVAEFILTPLVGVSKAELVNYVNATNVGMDIPDQAYILSGVYKAIEKAVADNMTKKIPLADMMGMGSLNFSTMFDMGAIGSEYYAKTTNGSSKSVGEAAVIDAVYNTMMENNLQGMCAIFGLLQIGNGLSLHPTTAGHIELADAVIGAYETGYTAGAETDKNLKGLVAAAFAEAYAYAKETGVIDTAMPYIDEAIVAATAAKSFVADMTVDATLVKTQALLVEELGNTISTLEIVKSLLADANLDADDFELLVSLNNDLLAHKAALEALGTELGVVATIYGGVIFDAVVYYADLIEDLMLDAYNKALVYDAEFAAAYAAFVDEIVASVNKISPELGAVVREYLTEVPAEAMAILYTAGEEAVYEFITVASAATAEIEPIITAISAVLMANATDLVKILNDVRVATVKAEIDAVNNTLAALKEQAIKAPIGTATNYQALILNAQADLAALQSKLVSTITAVAIEVVDPALGTMLSDLFVALQEAAAIATVAGTQYGNWFADRFDLMAGDLAALIVEKTFTFGVLAGDIIDDLIWNFLADAKADAEDKANDYLDRIGLDKVDLSDVKAVIVELETTAADIRAQIAQVKKYTSDDVDAEIQVLENALAGVENYAAKLNKLVTDVENLANDALEVEFSIEKVTSLVAQAEAIADDAEALVSEAKASLVILSGVYKQVLPVLSGIMIDIEEGSPVDVFLDSTNMQAEAFVASILAGYDNTLVAIETATANIDSIVPATIDVVCNSITEAVATISDATEVAVNDITATVSPALDLIKAEAEKLAKSTDAKVSEAGKQIYALVETLEVAYSEAALLEKHEEVKVIVNTIIAEVEKAETLDELKAILAEQETALLALADIANEVYAIAKGDAMIIFADVKALAAQIVAIATPVAGAIATEAMTAYGVSAAAICTVIDPTVKAVVNALYAYENAVIGSANVIINAVTDAATEIAANVVTVADTITTAVVTIATTAENGIASVEAAAKYIPYDATHGEYTVDADSYYVAIGNVDYAAALAAELGLSEAYVQLGFGDDYLAEVAKADLVTVTFDADQFAAFAYNQAMGTLVEVVKANEKIVGLLGGKFGPEIIAYLTDMGVDVNATVAELDWSKFDAATIAVKNEILAVTAVLLADQIDEPVVYFDLGAELVDMIGMDLGIVIEIPVLELAVAAVENVLYGYFEFAVEFPAVLDAIREAAPDAQLVVTGLNIPVKAVVEVLLAEFGVDLGAYGEYAEYVVSALNQHLFAYATINANTTYVDGIDAASILDALTVTVVTDDYLLGDVNLNGVVDMDDVVALMRHVLKAEIINNPTALAAGEVTGDDALDMDDVVKIMRYVLKAIDSLR